MTSPPPFQSRPMLGELFRQSQQSSPLADERLLRGADRVLETDYSATTQQQRWENAQRGRPTYAPRSEQFPGTPQFTPGIKAAYVAGTVSHRAAVGASVAGIGGALFMPGKAFGGSYNGAPATKTSRYFEKANPFVLCTTWALIGLGSVIFTACAAGSGDWAVGLGLLFGGVPALAGVLLWYLTCRTNRKEAQIVGGIAMLGTAGLLHLLSKMADSPVPTQQSSADPQPNYRSATGTWNPLGASEPPASVQLPAQSPAPRPSQGYIGRF